MRPMRYEIALQSDDPVGGLRNAVMSELERGVRRDDVLASLDEQRVAREAAGQERRVSERL